MRITSYLLYIEPEWLWRVLSIRILVPLVLYVNSICLHAKQNMSHLKIEYRPIEYPWWPRWESRAKKNSITYWRGSVIAALSQDYPWHVRSCLYGRLNSVVYRRMHTASAGITKRCVSGSLKNTVSPTAKENIENVKKITVQSKNSLDGGRQPDQAFPFRNHAPIHLPMMNECKIRGQDSYSFGRRVAGQLTKSRQSVGTGRPTRRSVYTGSS